MADSSDLSLPIKELQPITSSIASYQYQDSTNQSQSILSYLLWEISKISVKVLGFSLITVPASIIRLLSTNFSITLSFSSLFFILSGITFTLFSILRYRVLTSYSRFVEEPRTIPVVDPYVGSSETENKRRFGSYLDEFLTAIKIFGYLEKPVFNELTRSMKTQKLITDEILYVDEKLGFAIVVEGQVQIYSKVNTSNLNSKQNEEIGNNSPFSEFSNVQDDDQNELASEIFILNDERYQLLNDVKTGNPLSSLVNILSLFTDEDEFNGIGTSAGTIPTKSPFFKNHDFHPDVDIPEFSLDHGDDLIKTPNIIARATSDCTIAIIPADSFRRLKKKHPRSSSHIVQMILTRLYRVTFQTAHNYLGLTREIFQTEIKLNSNAKLELPSYLHNGVKQRFKKYQTTTSENRGRSKDTKQTPPTSFTPTTKRTDSSTSRTSLVTPSSRLESKIRPKAKRTESRHVVLDSRDSFNPGDLLSNVPLSRKELSYQAIAEDDVINRSFSAEEETEDTSLRIALVEGMFKFLGIDKENLLPKKSSTVTSALSSPIPQGMGLFTTFPQEMYTTRTSNINNQKTRTMSTTSNSRFSISSFNELENLIDPEIDFEKAKSDFANGIEILHIEQGSIIIEQNSRNNGLYYVVSGELDVTYTDPSTNNERLLYTVKPGGVAGYLGALVGYKSFVTLKAKTEVFVGFLPKKTLERLCEKYFMIYLSIAKSLISSLSKKILKLDSALEWIQLDAGETLFKQDTTANGIYIVLSGRLRSLYESSNNNTSSSTNVKNNNVKILAEYGQGESFGEVEVLTAAKRSSTFIAVRDSETARIPRTLFEILAIENPSIMIKVSRIVAKTIKAENNDVIIDSITQIPSITKFKNSNKNYRTVTILPITHGLPVQEFASRLIQSFKNVDRSVIGLDQASTLNHLGKHAFDRLSRLRQSGFFSDLEERYQIVVYIADTSVNSSWTTTCIQQGDCILLLADALSDTSIGDYERLLLKTRTTARTELILLHPERYVEPGLASKWLKNRVWVHSHHHIQFNTNSNELLRSERNEAGYNTFAKNIKTKVENLRTKYVGSKNNFNSTSPHKNDFLRLARLLSGQAVGLVLGGGGARGLSHLGVLKALQENGIPIDMIGGTSMGSFIGGLYAKDYDLVPIYGRAKKFAGRVSSAWRTLSDLTYPVTSYTTGHEFNRGIWKAFGDSRIEDFWIQYYCNSTNITNSTMDIHSSGYAWRFIRASMSLAGLLPPVTDNGSMLLDGGYVDNLPVGEMKNRGASIIFAVDVGSIDDRTPMKYGDSLSGLWILFNRWNPFSKHPNVPTMSEIQMRLCYVSSVNALERAKNTPGIIYLRPPIENYATLDFGKFEEIYNVGSIYGHMVLKELADTNKLPKIAGANVLVERQNRSIQRRNSI
ncbi:lysophospholipase [Wickerhamomyces ciferrii]|uniref:Lysophospholipase NTE1 n=1 Tax=Wickerhamomyces ciferrii (strain ATCC 14091 / BCRC 22168 / CBS 111 / JCM 3599 / NBRC 0793 / NRRL Y-1031 F-60-10) TaxID=1206466 RepID=K0KY37_WICCF|nr:lysophospholipase [Wickerhamomyces ciferrii]CCH46369.1 lysophospholipase [Wickerhamomyces ciferrii]